MRLSYGLHLFTALVAASYVVFGIFAPEIAGRLWWEYAIVAFVLGLLNLALDGYQRRRSRVRREKRARAAATAIRVGA